MHGRFSDLLRFCIAFPNADYSVAKEICKTFIELTAAGLFGIFTRFPSNLFPDGKEKPLHGAKIRNNYEL